MNYGMNGLLYKIVVQVKIQLHKQYLVLYLGWHQRWKVQLSQIFYNQHYNPSRYKKYYIVLRKRSRRSRSRTVIGTIDKEFVKRWTQKKLPKTPKPVHIQDSNKGFIGIYEPLLKHIGYLTTGKTSVVVMGGM